jgi:hypothetical protein
MVSMLMFVEVSNTLTFSCGWVVPMFTRVSAFPLLSILTSLGIHKRWVVHLSSHKGEFFLHAGNKLF